MKRLLLLCVCGGLFTSAAMAADPYERWLTKQSQLGVEVELISVASDKSKQSQRGLEIELIRVASEKPLIATEETDAEVASILKELEAIEEEISDTEKSEDSS